MAKRVHETRKDQKKPGDQYHGKTNQYVAEAQGRGSKIGSKRTSKKKGTR